MTLDFFVYCKERPDIEGLKGILDPDDVYEALEVRQIDRMQWEDIEIDIPKEHFHFSQDYDKPDIEAIAARAREQDHAIPKGFIDKLRTDGELNAAGIRARSGTDVGTMYTARADEEMLGYFDSHPFLAEAPEFSKVQTVARFSQGAPLYRVKLCAFIGASEEVVDRMAKLGLYLAKAYDGIMYDPQKSGFGPIDASAIVESASRFFKNVVALIECNAGQIIDQIVGGTDDNPE